MWWSGIFTPHAYNKVQWSSLSWFLKEESQTTFLMCNTSPQSKTVARIMEKRFVIPCVLCSEGSVQPHHQHWELVNVDPGRNHLLENNYGFILSFPILGCNLQIFSRVYTNFHYSHDSLVPCVVNFNFKLCLFVKVSWTWFFPS